MKRIAIAGVLGLLLTASAPVAAGNGACAGMEETPPETRYRLRTAAVGRRGIAGGCEDDA